MFRASNLLDILERMPAFQHDAHKVRLSSAEG